MKRNFWIVFVLLFSFGCTTQQINTAIKTVNDALATDELTSDEVGGGLKEALVKGIGKGVVKASATDGYFGNALLKIPFPKDAKKVENTLRDIGLGKEVDKFVKSLNRGAEDAAKSAKPIFVKAITSMTIQDAFGILKGEKNAATQYLRRTTESDLVKAFTPIIDESLKKVNATKYYGELITRYNKIPLVEKMNPDLTSYATQKAIDGLFVLVEEEEANIRANPIARTTELLKKVFGSVDK